MRMVMWRESWPLWAVLQGTTAPWPLATTWPTPVPQDSTVLSQTSMLLVSAGSLKYHLQWIQTEELKLCFWVHLNIFQNMKCILLVFEWNTIYFISASCSSCDPGKYCQTPGLTAPEGDCATGHWCMFGANTSTPTDGTTGDVCPQGSYCPVGSSRGRDLQTVLL